MGEESGQRTQMSQVEISSGYAGREAALSELFRTTFTASEGPQEGALLGDFVADLMQETPPKDLRAFCMTKAEALVAGVFFTPLRYAQDDRQVWLLSPMAVRPDRQGQGLGQRLIRHALDSLQEAGVEIVLSYGDPAFYGRVGFAPVTEDQAVPPHRLSMPQGWIGQALGAVSFTPLTGEARCVPAFDRPELW